MVGWWLLGWWAGGWRWAVAATLHPPPVTDQPPKLTPSQPTNHPTSQPTSDPTNQQTTHPRTQPTNQPTSHTPQANNQPAHHLPICMCIYIHIITFSRQGTTNKQRNRQGWGKYTHVLVDTASDLRAQSTLNSEEVPGLITVWQVQQRMCIQQIAGGYAPCWWIRSSGTIL